MVLGIRPRCALETRAPVAALLIRRLVGGVFLSEGAQEFLFPTPLDRSMLLGATFLLLCGAGPLSADARLASPEAAKHA